MAWILSSWVLKASKDGACTDSLGFLSYGKKVSPHNQPEPLLVQLMPVVSTFMHHGLHLLNDLLKGTGRHALSLFCHCFFSRLKKH